RTQPIVMGSYGIGVGRLLACVAEEHRDDRGLCLPVSVAPYHVALLSLGKTDRMKQAAEKLYGELQAAGVEVLFDDRDTGAGVKEGAPHNTAGAPRPPRRAAARELHAAHEIEHRDTRHEHGGRGDATPVWILVAHRARESRQIDHVARHTRPHPLCTLRVT